MRRRLKLSSCIRACLIVSRGIWCLHRLRHWRDFTIRTRVLPEPERDWKRVDIELPPPCGLVTRAMQVSMVDPANRDDELVAYTACECTRLCKGEMMRIRGHAAAHETRLSQHESPVILIAQANHFSQSTDCIAARLLLGGEHRCILAGTRVRRTGHPGLAGDGMSRLMAARIIRHRTRGRTVTSPMRGADRGKSCPELLLHHFRVCSCQRVLGREIPMRPGRRLVRRIDSRHLLNQALPKACR